MAMDDFQDGPPARALPSHLLNGHSSPRSAGNDHKERDNAIASIKSSMGPRKVAVDLDGLSLDMKSPPSMSNGHARLEKVSTKQYVEVEDQDLDAIESRVAARTEEDEAAVTPPAANGEMSPYITSAPAVDFDGLSWPSTGTLARLHEKESQEEAQARLQKLAGAVRTMLECIGEDPDREGLHGTPMRYAKAMMFFTKGYEENLRDIVNGAVFHEDHDELVIVKDIEVYSLCEHHLVPFTGKVGQKRSGSTRALLI